MRHSHPFLLLLAFAAAGCSTAVASPTATPQPSPTPVVSSPVAAISPSPSVPPTATPVATPTPTPTPSPTAVVPHGEGSVKLSTVTAVCLAHGKQYSSDTIAKFVSDCPNMLQSALSVLGTRATTVVRMMATDCLKDCAENVIVGFADGHLEGTFMVPVQPGTAGVTGPAAVAADAQPESIVLMSTDWRWAAYPMHPLAASAWPWKDAAPFDSPKVKRTDLRLAPAALRNRTPVPFCGLMWEGPGPEQNPEARACFERAVRTGHPAEYITHGSGTEGQDLWGLYRFTGTGSVEEWNVGIGQYEDGTWRSSRIALPVYDN